MKKWILGFIGVGAVVAASVILTLQFSGGTPKTLTGAHASNAATSSPSSSPSTASCRKPALKITSPKNGTAVNGAKGVLFRGTLCAPASYPANGTTGLWAFDSTDAEVYNFDSPATPGDIGPITPVTEVGSVYWRDYPMGDPHVTKQKNTVTFVLANAACQRKLLKVKPDANGDTVIYGQFPKGCVVIGKRWVSVTNH